MIDGRFFEALAWAVLASSFGIVAAIVVFLEARLSIRSILSRVEVTAEPEPARVVRPTFDLLAKHVTNARNRTVHYQAEVARCEDALEDARAQLQEAEKIEGDHRRAFIDAAIDVGIITERIAP